MRPTTLLVSAVLAAAAVLAAHGRSAAHEEPGAAAPLVGIWGAHSAVKETTILRVTSQEEWSKLYLRHLGKDPAAHSDHFNEAGVPDVDFARCMAVTIFQGERVNSAGVRIESIEEDDERLLVRFDDRSYQTEGPDGGAQHVTAFGLFVLARSKKPLVVEENVQSLLGQPPKWKERARFPGMER